ncbi:MAG TPA: glycosyltransferase family 4 protein [Thermoanaerobaculia bacterium]|nr:glycosyltransferase family 4 protein [Thermoanaerobaculia bacterium]
MSRHRVFLLSHHGRDVPGGAPLADTALAAALSELGHEADLLFYGDVLPGPVRATWRQLLFPWAAAVAFLRRHPERRYDVIESTAGDAWVIRLLLPLFSGERPLLSLRTHGLEPRRAEADLARLLREGKPPGLPTRLYHFRWRLAEVARDLRAADAVFLLNQEDARYAVERLGLPPERVHVLPNGLPGELLSLPETDGSPERGFRLLFVGAWSPAKGADLLPGIVRRVFARDARFRLTCAGTGETEERVLAGFDPADRGRIAVVPRFGRGELPGLLLAHGVFLFPSPAEGSSLALLEAMAGGLVPVTTRTGQAADLIEPGGNGFLAEAGDADGFAAAVLAATKDPETARRLGKNARASVSGFSWKSRAAERVRIWDGLAREAA